MVLRGQPRGRVGRRPFFYAVLWSSRVLFSPSSGARLAGGESGLRRFQRQEPSQEPSLLRLAYDLPRPVRLVSSRARVARPSRRLRVERAGGSHNAYSFRRPRPFYVAPCRDAPATRLFGSTRQKADGRRPGPRRTPSPDVESLGLPDEGSRGPSTYWRHPYRVRGA